MAKLYTPDEVQKIEETKKATKTTKPTGGIVGRMPEDFRKAEGRPGPGQWIDEFGRIRNGRPPR